MGTRGCIDDHLIITKHKAGAFHWHAEVVQGEAQINYLLRAGVGSNTLRSEGGSLDG